MFVSNILLFNRLIAVPHTFVYHLVADMEQSGWHPVAEPREGAVLTWGVRPENGDGPHVGFYVGNGNVISNNSELRVPRMHHWTYGEVDGLPVWPTNNIYWHPSFDEKK